LQISYFLHQVNPVDFHRRYQFVNQRAGDVMKLIAIKSFMFDNAQYIVADDNGNQLMLTAKYKANEFEIKVLKSSGVGLKSLKKEVGVVAEDLLGRKHGVNFASKLGGKS